VAEGATFKLNIATELGPTAAFGRALEIWAQEIERASEGRITHEIFFSDGLVPQVEILDAFTSGLVDAAILSGGYHASQLPLWVNLGSVHDLDYSTRWTPADQIELVSRLLAEFPEMEAQLAAHNIKYMHLHPVGPHNLMGAKPVNSVDDLRGLRIRTYGTGIPRMFEAAGGIPVSLPFGEVYSSLSTGAVDAAYTGVDNFKSISLQEIAGNLTIFGEFGSSPLMGSGLSTVVRLDLWESLSPADQQIFLDANRVASEWLSETTLELHYAAVEHMRGAGVTIAQFTAADLAAFRALLPDVWAPAADAITAAGSDGAGFVSRALELAAEIDAAR
jgi:TRAP-type C4-dicarboxylate transport system substrate-binding protein